MILPAFAVMAFLSGASVATLPPVTDISKPTEISAHFDPDATARVVNVWATWCAPCVAEIGDLEAIDEHYSARGVQVVGVSMDDVIPGDRGETRTRVRRFLGSKGVRYTNLFYTGLARTLQDELRFEGEIPITIVYDRSGREAWRVQGRLDRAKLEAQLEKLLGARPERISK